MDLDDRHEFGRSGDLPAGARTLWHGRFTGGPDEALLAACDGERDVVLSKEMLALVARR